MNPIIITDLETTYGILCKEITPINGGWLNKLWKVTTNNGDILLKQYSNKRYNTKKLHDTDVALQRQMIIKKDGIICPHIYMHEGCALRFLDDVTTYAIMDFCEGQNESPETITLTQMQSLGSNCALMHKAFSKLEENTVKGFPIDSAQLLASLWENFNTRKQKLSVNDPEGYQKALLGQELILEQLTADFFDKLPKGITHEDYTPDNILFDENGVSAIIDFDRNQYSFLWHDIGRAILSFALEDNQLNIEKIHTFIKGYSEHLPLTISNVIDALRISWCIEILWWIMPSCFTMDYCKASRYRDEIVWVTEHWFELDSILQI